MVKQDQVMDADALDFLADQVFNDKITPKLADFYGKTRFATYVNDLVSRWLKEGGHSPQETTTISYIRDSSLSSLIDDCRDVFKPLYLQGTKSEEAAFSESTMSFDVLKNGVKKYSNRQVMVKVSGSKMLDNVPAELDPLKERVIKTAAEYLRGNGQFTPAYTPTDGDRPNGV